MIELLEEMYDDPVWMKVFADWCEDNGYEFAAAARMVADGRVEMDWDHRRAKGSDQSVDVFHREKPFGGAEVSFLLDVDEVRNDPAYRAKLRRRVGTYRTSYETAALALKTIASVYMEKHLACTA